MKNLKYLYIVFIGCLVVQCTPKVSNELVKPVVVEEPKETWRATSPDAGPARTIEMGEYNVFDMPNGLKVIVVENHKLPRVSYQLSLNNFPVLEKDQAGYVSIAGDLLGRGTKTRSKAEIDVAIDQVGASMNTSSSGIFGSSLTKHQETLLTVMSDVLLNPTFKKEEFDKLITQYLSGIQSSKDDPNTIAANVAGTVNYGEGHPYGEVETEETVNAIDLNKCKKYYKDHFLPNNAYLTIVGDISLGQAKANAEKYFGAWKSGKVPEYKYAASVRPKEPTVSVANKEGAVQSVIRVTYPVEMQPGSDDALHAAVMNSILGGGIFLGRLMQNLREDKAFTYGARSSLRADQLIGSFSASASVRNEVTDSSVVEFLYEMDKISSEPISEKDLQLAKNSMAGSFARSLESPQSLARYAQNIVKFNLSEDHYTTYLSRLEKVTVDDVLAIAKRHITTSNANIVIVGNKDEISDKLLRFDGDGVIDYYDAFGKKLEISNDVIPDGVTGKSIMNSYLKAIGGAETISKIMSMELTYDMNVMGQNATFYLAQQAPNKAYNKVGTEAMVFQEQKYDGTKAWIAGMGQPAQVVTEGPMFNSAKEMGTMFSQTAYLTDDYELELKGLDQINGESCYKVVITNKALDEKHTEFYSVKSGYMLKQVKSTKGPGGTDVSVSQEFKNYEKSDGVSLPTEITISGAMPTAMTMKLNTAKINADLDQSMFKIEE